MFCLLALLHQIGAYCGLTVNTTTGRLRKGGLHRILNIIGLMDDVQAEECRTACWVAVASHGL